MNTIQIDLDVFTQAPGSLNYARGLDFHLVPTRMTPCVALGGGLFEDFAVMFDAFDSKTLEKVAEIIVYGVDSENAPYREESNTGNMYFFHAAADAGRRPQDHALLEFLKVAALEPAADIADAITEA